MNKKNPPSLTPRRSRQHFLGAAGTAVGATMLGPTGLGAIAAPAPLPNGLQSGPNRRPNLLVIITDSEQWRSSYPSDLDLPNHDRLRDQATTFSRYHVNTIACGPSRSVMHSGQHIQKTRVYDNPIMTRYPGRIALDPELTPTLNQILPDRGYVIKESEQGPGSGYGLAIFKSADFPVKWMPLPG
ncbi:MAG: sulfatase-like hydrolase/transferase [Gammaproteobacteria bacterium]|nr:sulfatase-like hydrolase/transferase [Gammaproteobacteria bacterium]